MQKPSTAAGIMEVQYSRIFLPKKITFQKLIKKKIRQPRYPGSGFSWSAVLSTNPYLFLTRLLQRVLQKHRKNNTAKQYEPKHEEYLREGHVEEKEAAEERAAHEGERASDPEKTDDVRVTSFGVLEKIAFGRDLNEAGANASDEHGNDPRNERGCRKERYPGD